MKHKVGDRFVSTWNISLNNGKTIKKGTIVTIEKVCPYEESYRLVGFGKIVFGMYSRLWQKLPPVYNTDKKYEALYE